jgi:hypothetical protein
MSDILHEFTTMAAKAAECSEWLAGQGIGPDIVYRPGATTVGVARIEVANATVPSFSANGTPAPLFQPNPDGIPAIVVPVSYGYGPCELNPIDLVAWKPGSPDQWYFRRGEHGLVLGVNYLERAELFHEPIQLHRTPLDWVRVSGDGACLLDHSPSVLDRLREVGEIITGDFAYGLDIEKRLQRAPTIPSISIINFEKEAV